MYIHARTRAAHAGAAAAARVLGSKSVTDRYIPAGIRRTWNA